MALCTQTDVEQRLQIDFTSDTDPVIASLIAAAQAHIEREAGRTLEAGSRTEVFDADRNPLFLRNTPVNSITSVTVDGTALTSADYLSRSDGRLYRVSSGYPMMWETAKLQSISVVYNGGYTTVPDDLRDICARAAARAFQAGAAYSSAPDGAGGIRQIALQGSDSVTFASAVSDVTALVSLTREERDIIRHYRQEPIA